MAPVYVCYLDDSGTHGNAEVVVSGGYIAPRGGWRRYEREAAKFYEKHKITVFHSKKFKKNFGEFHGWSAAKHMGFIQCMINAAVDADAVGVTVGLDKKLLAARKKEHGFLPQTSAYAQSFKNVLDRLAADDEVGPLIRKGGLSVVIERGMPTMKTFVRSSTDCKGYRPSTSWIRSQRSRRGGSGPSS